MTTAIIIAASVLFIINRLVKNKRPIDKKIEEIFESEFQKRKNLETK